MFGIVENGFSKPCAGVVLAGRTAELEHLFALALRARGLDLERLAMDVGVLAAKGCIQGIFGRLSGLPGRGWGPATAHSSFAPLTCSLASSMRCRRDILISGRQTIRHSTSCRTFLNFPVSTSHVWQSDRAVALCGWPQCFRYLQLLQCCRDCDGPCIRHIGKPAAFMNCAPNPCWPIYSEARHVLAPLLHLANMPNVCQHRSK